LRRFGDPLRLGAVVAKMDVVWFRRDMASQVGSSSQIHQEKVIFGTVMRWDWDWERA
jgi:hypothetical protein